jgi:excisionase family DNA binding protein
VLEDLLTVRELARKMCLTEMTIYRYIAKRTIPYYKFDKAVRFIPSEVETWMKERKKGKAQGNKAVSGELFTATENTGISVEACK